MEPKARYNATAPMIEAFATSVSALQGLPPASIRLTRLSELVIFADFLAPEEELTETFSRLAKQGVRGHLVQILDPAEEVLPYSGRVEFVDDEQGHRYVAERVESVRDAYRLRLKNHKAAIAGCAKSLGWSTFIHHTDRPAVEVLLSLHLYLSGLEKAYRAKGSIKGKMGVGIRTS
jgi:uncharacterized protein (DUF58 family)